LINFFAQLKLDRTLDMQQIDRNKADITDLQSDIQNRESDTNENKPDIGYSELIERHQERHPL
jgi:hypothetical protein